MKRIWVSLVALMLFSGCLKPIPVSETIPVYSGKPPATIAVAVVDHRPFILNNDKEEWFEGILRGRLGIPESHGRSLDPNQKPFALYLANKIREALEKAGSQATVVEVPKGSSVKTVINRVHSSHSGAALIVMMYQSRYDIPFYNSHYRYDLELIILGSDGKSIGRKTFGKRVDGIKMTYKYNLLDLMAKIYKENLDIILNDPEIKNALDEAAAGS